jgi:tetratricopeptide (TPR) repeat protein
MSAHALTRHGGARDPDEVQALLEFAREHGHLLLEAGATRASAFPVAMRGDRDAALALIARARAMLVDLGHFTWSQSRSDTGFIYEWFGDTESAIAEFEAGVRALQEIGERGFLSTEASTLALLLLDLERVDEARDALKIAQEAGAPDDIVTQVEIHAARARILAREGDLVEAERLARSCVEEGDTTDYIILFTLSRMALGDVLRLAGKKQEAAAVVEEAAATEERRGNLPYANQLRRTAQRWTAS